MKQLLIGLFLLAPSLAFSSDKKNEAFFCDAIATSIAGESEVRTKYNKRIDILTDTAAAECDWSHKWAEAIGQALTYGELEGKQPAMIIFHDISKKQNKNTIGVLIHMSKTLGIDLLYINVDRISGDMEFYGSYNASKDILFGFTDETS